MQPEPGPLLSYEEITTADGLERLCDEWTALWRCTPHATPFQSPAWLIAWWKHLGEGELWTLAFRVGGELVGIAPLYRYRQPESGRRDVLVVGTGTSDYLDVLFAPGCQAPGMQALFQYLHARRDEWDVCDFQQLQPASPLLTSSVPNAWINTVSWQEVCPTVSLPDASGHPYGWLTPAMRHSLSCYQRRAEKAQVQCVRAETDVEVSECFETLVGLHEARWKEKGEAGVLHDPRVQEMHREALPGLASLGVLRFYALRSDSEILACYYGFLDTDRAIRRAWAYIGGFDPRHAHLSPGTLLIAHAMQEAIREGADVFDFLRGSEAYKYRWGAKDQRTFRRLITAGDVRAAL